MSRVIINNLNKQYTNNVVVKDFSIEINDGEFITFLGPSGCGKTTNLRMIAGFIKPTSGEIVIGDRIVSNPEKNIFIPPEERKLGMVFQSYAVWPHMNVFNNIAYPLKIKKENKKNIEKKVAKILELVDMKELSLRFPHELSGGQQQRVALARALVMEPEVLLLDEPLSNLDAKLREEMRIEIKELQRKTGITIIFVTHDQMEAMLLSDRVVVMEKGNIHQIDDPHSIYQNPADYFVADFIGNANFIDPVLLEIKENNEGKFVMIRPEDVVLDNKNGRFSALVKQKMFIGEGYLYILDFRSNDILVKTHSRNKFNIGENIKFDLISSHIIYEARRY